LFRLSSGRALDDQPVSSPSVTKEVVDGPELDALQDRAPGGVERRRLAIVPAALLVHDLAGAPPPSRRNEHERCRLDEALHEQPGLRVTLLGADRDLEVPGLPGSSRQRGCCSLSFGFANA
jgi:hypothetical protein